jgi:hypothetical protein
MSKDDKLQLKCPDTNEAIYPFPPLSKDAIKDLAGHFPDSVEIDLSWLPWGDKKTFKVKENAEALIKKVNDLPAPRVEIDFDIEGDCDDFEAITISNSEPDIIGTSSGSVQVVNLGASYEFEVKVRPYPTKTIECKCDNGKQGRQKSRRFHVKWYLKFTVNPGVGGKYLVDDFWITVLSCCCCADKTGEEDPKEAPKESQKKKQPMTKKIRQFRPRAM